MAAITNITSRTLWKRVLGYRYFGPSDHTANYSLRATQSGGTFTNRGASGGIEFTLPGAAKGAIFRFVLATADSVKIFPHTSAGQLEMDIGGTWGIQTAGNQVNCADDGAYVTFQCKGDDDWIAVNQKATWATGAS
tara:strand:+ start:61 stop:468 length:408 start_codon:yes stop_codon:yes gene_type:complete